MADAQARIVISARDDTAGALAKAKAGFAGLQGQVQSVATGFIAANAALGAVLGGAGLISLFTNSVRSIDALNDLKDATGASIENLSALEDVAARTGSSFETVGQALVKFNQVLLQATPNSGPEKTLRAIGLSATELRKLDPAEALRRVAVALNGYADDGNKARIIADLFGKSIREVAPLLNDLAKKTELVGKVTTAQADQAEKFNQQLDALKKNSTDTARALASDILPAMNELLERFRKAKEEGSLLSDTLKNLGFVLSGQATNSIVGIGSTELQRLEQKRVGLENIKKTDEELGRAENIINSRALDNINKQIKSIQTLNSFKSQFKPDVGVNPAGLFKKSAPQVPDASNAISEFDKYLKKLNEGVFSVNDLTEVEKVRYEIAYGSLKKITDIQKVILFQNAQAIDDIKAAGEDLLGPQIPDNILKKRADAAKDVANILSQTNQGQINALTQQYGDLETALQNGEITTKQYVDALDLLDQKFGELQPVIKDTSQKISEFSKEAAQSIQGVVGDSVLAAIEGDFDSILGLWENMLKKMIAQAIATDLNNALFGSLFGNSGSGSGLIGGFLLGLPGRAAGGPVESGHAYMVGEQGPELFMPRNSGTIVPNGGGGTVNVTYNIQQVGSGVSRGEVIAGLSAVRDSTRAEFSQLLARKGLA